MRPEGGRGWERGGAAREKRGVHTRLGSLFVSGPSLLVSGPSCFSSLFLLFVAGRQSLSPRLGVRARLLGSRLRVDFITLFSSPEPCCRQRRGRASQVPRRAAFSPETAPTGRSARLLPRPHPNERACDTCRHEARARGPRRRDSRSGHRGTTRKGKSRLPFFFFSLGSV